MALTVGTNSYVDADYAEAYFEDRFHSYTFGWSDIGGDDQEKLLITATTHIDVLFDHWGEKHDTDTPQSLEYPRAEDGNDSPTVPTNVNYAVCELALYIYNYGVEFLDSPINVKIDKFQVELDENTSSPFPKIVLSLMQPYGELIDNTKRIYTPKLDR